MNLGPPPIPNRAGHPFVGSLVWRGLAINIENRAGSYRSGVDVDGNPWRTQLRNHYGEFALTLGMDGDPVDVFIGPDLDAPDVYVVHTKVPGTQRPDEDKAIIGARSQDEARRIFMDNYDRRGFYHGITKWKAEEFVAHLRSREHEGKRLDEPLAKGEPADEHTSALGELKAWRIQTEPEDLGGYSLGKGPKGVSSSAPNYRPSTGDEPRCATCQFQQAGECLPYGFRFEQGYICDSWSPTGGAGFDYETTMEPEQRAARAVLTDIQHQADEAIEAIQHQAAEQAEDIVRWAPRATKATTSATIRATVPQDLEGVSSPARDLIPGGLADDKIDADFDPKALDEGAKVEAEHTSNRAVAREIARDHLTEDPDYYDKLERIEKGTGPKVGRPVVLMRRMVKAQIKGKAGLHLDTMKHRWVRDFNAPVAPGHTLKTPHGAATVTDVRDGMATIKPEQAGRAYRMPATSVRHHEADLNGKLHGTPTSGNAVIDGAISGKGKLLGKGNDGIAYQVGDKVVKVSTTTPFVHDNPGHRTPEGAVAHLRQEFEAHQALKGNPLVPEVEWQEHEGRGWLVKPFLKDVGKLSRPELDDIEKAVDDIHRAGWAIGDEIQLGRDAGGKVRLMDLGQASKEKMRQEDDQRALDRVFKAHGVDDRLPSGEHLAEAEEKHHKLIERNVEKSPGMAANFIPKWRRLHEKRSLDIIEEHERKDSSGDVMGDALNAHFTKGEALEKKIAQHLPDMKKAMPGMGLNPMAFLRGGASAAAPPGGGAPGPIKNRPGLRLDQQKHRWVKSTPDQPKGPQAPGQGQDPAAGESHPAMGRPVRFRHPQTGETLQGHVTGVGAHGATIHTAEGEKHKVPHGHYAVQGGAASQGEAQGPGKGAEQPQGAPAAQAKPQGPPRPRSYDAIKQAHQKLDEHEQARRYFTDRNTGLLNARGADAQPHDPKRPMTARFSFEGMKAFNDQFGHDIPDGALRHMAAALSKHIPDGVKRGGDIEGDVRDQSHADKIAEEMSKAIDPSGRIRVIATAVPRKPNHRDTLEALGDAHRKRKDAEVEAGRLGHRLKNPVAFQKDQGGMKAVAERMKAGPKGAHASLSPHHKAEFDRVGKDKAFEVGHVEDTGLLTDDGFHRSHELNPDHHVASADMRGLQGINDAFGRDAADMILKEFSSLIARNGGGDFHAAHPHGDEYLAHHEDPAKLREFFGHLKNAADGVAFFMERPDGQVVVQHGLNFVHGVGKDLDEADRVDLARNKQAQGDVQPPAVVDREEAHRRLADLGRRGVRLIDLGASAPASIRPVQGQGAPGPVERMVAGRHADQELALRRALEYAMERGQAAEVDRFRSEWEQAAEEAGRELLAEGQEAEFDALMDERDDLGAKLTAEDLRKVLGQAELVAKDGVQFRTGSPVTFRYARALAGDQSKFGADIQPAGVYLFHLVDEGGMKAPGWDTGTMSFRNPLVLEWVAATSEPQGWRARLSYHFGGKRGKDLSRAIRLAGYDGVVTVRSQWQEAGEIVDLRRTVDWANTAPVQVLMRLGRSLAVIDPMRLATQLGLFGAQAAAPAAPAPKHEATVHVKAHVRTTADGKAVLVPAHDRVVEKVEDEPRVALHDAFRMKRHEIDHALMEHADHAPTVAALKAELARREAKRAPKPVRLAPTNHSGVKGPTPQASWADVKAPGTGPVDVPKTDTFEEFAKAYEAAFRDGTPDGASRMAALADAHPDWAERAEAEWAKPKPKAIDKLAAAEKQLDKLQSAQGGTYKRVQASVRQADRVDALKAKAIEEAKKKAAAEGRPYFREEFTNWFGDWAQEPDKASKVVDKNGIPEEQFGNAPVKLYHGTPVGGFRSFSKEKDKGYNIFGKGFYFTADRKIAEEYTKKDEKERLAATTGFTDLEGNPVTTLSAAQARDVLEAFGWVADGRLQKKAWSGNPDDYTTRGYPNPNWDFNAVHAIGRASNADGTVDIAKLIEAFWNPTTASEQARQPKADPTWQGGTKLARAIWKALGEKKVKPQVPSAEVKEVYLNIRNPIDMDKPIPMEEFQEFAAHTSRLTHESLKRMLASAEDRLQRDRAHLAGRQAAIKANRAGNQFEVETAAKVVEEQEAHVAEARARLAEHQIADTHIHGVYLDDLLGYDEHKTLMGKSYSEPHTYADLLKLKGLLRDRKRTDGRDAHGILKVGPADKLTWGDFHYLTSNGHHALDMREKFTAWAKSRGYDGIHHTGGWNIGSHEHSVWIAFEPNQIKATTSEKFDPSTDDMYKGHRLVVRMDLARVKPVGGES